MSGPSLFLLENLLWELNRWRIARNHAQQYKPFPLPSEDERLFSVSDVSIIVPTVGWDESEFTQALVSWLANKPHKIIVVTTRSEGRKTADLLASDPIDAANQGTEIRLLTVRRPNKREQLVEGINACRQSDILALVDDDAFWTPDTLMHLLAPFQNPDVGLVGGPIDSYVPKERQDPAVITAWEVAALRNRSKRRGGHKEFYAADGSTNFTVSGATMLIRAEIATDPDFQHAFVEEKFLGVRLNTGDDAFITRWVLFQHLKKGREELKQWKLGMQITPEASVYTTLLPDSRFVRQMKRWLRTGLRLRLTCMFVEPGMRGFRRTTPHMCRRMAESLYDPILNILWYVAFFSTLRSRPVLALLIALFYLYRFVSGILAFAREYPYCRDKIWAAILTDVLSRFWDWYSCLTLTTETWDSRQGVDFDDQMRSGNNSAHQEKKSSGDAGKKIK
ncbi:nucleotide-diphospho-sugar transferase [Xylaria nigripes]|nr:nucleotide-diphospho-sugar transferase [Xylaria nigripes]KAI2636849.1 nucleotide-diphospho-sugar transferase [Xylaria nigripes]